ncbi:C4-dicarboxylate TRAP transporter substrate-binding protein [Chachezhania sediminis]|uniref:C4-dicarboxylate TRAP transporter substrate-binding protein n=1 Tax=Chachezhania sediminis TaxID=2599291 RepID=UPI00131C9978|nr:C4-dicarboxylate TRAP transporter substrate-binding protein [Chachezhania sediminis]
MVKYSILAALAVTTIGAGAAQSETIRATSGYGPSHHIAKTVYPAISTKLSELTDGRWDVRDTSSGLLKPNEMNTGLRDGITELAPNVLTYFSADYPESTMVGELSTFGSDSRAISGAVSEYILTCPECLAEFDKFGQVFVGTTATNISAVLSTTPIENLDDFKGLRIRTVTPTFSKYIASLGAEPVQMPSSEMFEALSQGIINAAFSSISNIRSGGLFDTIKYVVEVRQGVLSAYTVATPSKMLWGRMTPEDRAAFLEALQFGIATDLEAWVEGDAEVKQMAMEQGTVFVEPDETIKAASRKFNEEHLETLAVDLTARGIEDAPAKIDRYLSLLEKWEELVADVDTVEELTDLRMRELWSDIDLANYGN